MSEKHLAPLILIADDQKPTTVMLERVFEYEGYRAHSVYDGISAIDAAQTMLPDLILLDINMPGLNGFEVLKKLRDHALTANIPTILITAMGELSNVVQGLNLGADDYLRKPFHPQELLARAQSKMRARKLEEALQNRTRELEALLRASEELSQHLEMAELLDIAAYLIADLLPTQAVAVHYLDEQGEILDYRLVGQLTDDCASVTRPAFTEACLKELRPVRWPGDVPLVPGIANGIVVPMHSGGYVRGLLTVLNNQAEYDDNHERLLAGIGRQAILALQNAELYDIQANYALHLEEMVAERTAELESTQKMLIRSEKLASVGRLAASIAHEIRNPLLPIRINLENMFEDIKQKQAIDPDDITKTLESVERINTIVARLLGFTGNRQVDDSDFERLDVNQVIESVIDLNRKFFQQEGVNIESNLSVVPSIYGSKFQLEHVFMNLALNAMDAMENGGTLSIATRHENGDVIAIVQDTGVGILPDIIDTIFEPFVSTKNSGNGLGLFISYGIVQKHNGTIHVANSPQAGACFTLTFPASLK